MKNKRINIALFASHLEDDYAKTVCKGAMMAAREADANLFIIPGRYFDANYEDKERTQYRYQYETLFSYVNSENIDVLIIMMETIGSTWSHEEKQQLLRRFSDIPIINISPDIEGYNCVHFDNKTGLRDGIEHLIKKHNRKKIGFVSGPVTNTDAIERLQVYKDTMTANGLEFDESMISYGYFSEYSEEATETLLDSCPEIDAIVFSNDKMAIGGYQVMTKRGIRIGKDISVIGFDDIQNAMSLNPKLTTVRADATEIGYRSVLEAVNLIEFGRTKDPIVDSRLVVRGSCGCCRSNLNSNDNEYINELLELKPNMLSTSITDFVFENYKSTLPVNSYKMCVFSFFNVLIAKIIKGDIVSREADMDIISRLDVMLESDVSEYVSIEKILFALNIVLKYIVVNKKEYHSPEKFLVLTEMFTNIYNYMVTQYAVENSLHANDIEYLSWMTNSLTRDMLMFVGDDKCYGTISEKLSAISMGSSYIFSFNEPIRHLMGQEWIPPEKTYVKSYHNGNEVYIVPAEKQQIDTSDIFRNEFLPQKRQYSMVLSALYSNEDQYGLWLCELDYRHFYYIAPITVQLCAAINTMHLIRKQEVIQSRLKESLEQIRQNNIILDNISKSDELTGIYNRRGFFEMAHSLISDKKNDGKRAIVVFADMDCLKVINDRFGHEEGDYAIRKSAEILTSSFRSTDIVGRIGGDEFAALAIVNCSKCTEIVKRRIQRNSDKINSESGKSYLINISIGISEFQCSPEVSIKDILDEADGKLYIEKKNKVKNVIKY